MRPAPRAIPPVLGSRLAARALPCLALGLALACAHADPVAHDPVRPDPAHPPAMQALAIESHGSALNAVLYLADGPGPHPTAIFLHGLPGNERNLDLAQAVRRSGWNALFFHYRGAWGSGGDYAFAHVLEDVASAVAWTRSPERDPALRIDPERVALVGHSLGGFAALRVGAESEGVDCIASLAGANLAGHGQRLRDGDEGYADTLAGRFQTLVAPLRGTSGEALAAELGASVGDFDVLRLAPALARKPLLLVAGERDAVVPPAEAHDPLVTTLEAMAPISLTALRLDADHAFSQKRVALARALVAWLNGPCARALD